MSRSIKFRVFHAGKMHYGPVVFEGKTYGGLYGISINGEAIYDDPLTGVVTGPWPPTYALMQFTGLIDSEGKEIYGGDIVEYDLRKEVVEMKGGGFSPFAIPGWEVTPTPDEVRVVGNIHEKPDLIG